MINNLNDFVNKYMFPINIFGLRSNNSYFVNAFVIITIYFDVIKFS